MPMAENLSKKIGRYEYLQNRRASKLFRRLLSVEFGKMPFYKYAIALATLLKDDYYVNTLIVGQALRETDITWFLKDFTTNLEFVSDDFSQFELDPDLYSEIKLIEQDFLQFRPGKRYDLVVVLDDITRIYPNLQDYLINLYNVTQDNGLVIFFIRYYSQELIIDEDVELFKSTDAFVKYLPFKVRSKVEMKNYDKGRVQTIDLVIDSFKH
jgi:hypothetical protein